MSTALPNRSIRIAPEHIHVLNSVLSLLRSGRADDVRAAISDLENNRSRPIGPFRNAEAALGFLLGRMVAAGHPDAIWLFGSRARGTPRIDSDFDLLAVFADGSDAEIDERRNRMADAVAACGIGVDIVACTAAQFDEFGETAGSLVRTVRGEGREVYASPAVRRRRRRGRAP